MGEMGTVDRVDPELLKAEERIAHTGGLAAFAGACARRPGRVIGGWIAIFVVLIGLNAAFHGKLINDFKIPGSDTQKATDLSTRSSVVRRVLLCGSCSQRRQANG